ncbi:MAG: hypothetical protein LBD20_09695 [Spirochaetaceae bacterium]|nr:hypothetical protein [Spirochaetaceae bacterium]
MHTPLDFTVRAQGFDRRPSPFNEKGGNDVQDFGLALYNPAYNARILYGDLNSWGLANRTRNVWGHNVPSVESHKDSGADLKTSVAAEPKHAFYARLGSPAVWPINFYAAVLVSPPPENAEQYQAEWIAGADYHFTRQIKAGVEGYVKSQMLPERGMSSWFSDSPRLPDREFNFYAASLTFASPIVSFASDVAFSETFAWGEGLYANTAVRFDYKPFRFELAADGASSRFTGNNGTTTGEAFRTAASFEFFGTASSRFKASTSLQSAAVGKAFGISSSTLYYRLPVLGSGTLNVSYLSLGFARDAGDNNAIADGIDAAIGFRAGPFRPSVKYSWKGLTVAEPGSAVIVYPNLATQHQFVSGKLSMDLGFAFSMLYLRASLVYEEAYEKEARWKTGFYGSLSWKLGFVSLKIDEKEDGGFTYTVSTRLSLSF